MSDNVLAPGRPSAAGNWLHRFANPGRFLRLVTPLLPSLAVISVALTALGMVWGFGFSPADWQQGDSVKIMYVHVPAAWVSMAGYASLAICSFFSLVWRHPLADLAAEEIGPVGAGFTGVCLVSGALWGKPEWGAYWVWDARLTSVLILFFLYLGHIALIRAFDNRAHGYRAAAILALVGAINLPIIVFSVQWWNTLHQGNSISSRPRCCTRCWSRPSGFTCCFSRSSARACVRRSWKSVRRRCSMRPRSAGHERRAVCRWVICGDLGVSGRRLRADLVALPPCPAPPGRG
jgi:heme exporter protein C